jgi:hypothetical protein
MDVLKLSLKLLPVHRELDVLLIHSLSASLLYECHGQIADHFTTSHKESFWVLWRRRVLARNRLGDPGG